MGLQGEVHSIWDLWTSDLQECKGDLYLELDREDNSCRSGVFKNKKIGFSIARNF